ncbi:MAG: hypothetical protein HY900_26060 [Deltaproteobacteria bacterium]|nr:hypothetical protein [Deltaproteobacteria bacterium]
MKKTRDRGTGAEPADWVDAVLARFEQVRAQFFPEWDRRRRWRVRVVRDDAHVVIASFEPAQRELQVRPTMASMDSDTVEALLVHEIAHHVSLWHGAKWQRRMLEAADAAESFGNDILAEKLRYDVEMYRGNR